MGTKLSVIVLVVVLVVSKPILAHHGTAAYDTSQTVTVKAMMTEFDFTNPHCTLFFDVKTDKGEIEKWVGEARSPSMLGRIGGWDKNTIKPGDVITASGHRTKNGANFLRLIKVVLPDGREMGNL